MALQANPVLLKELRSRMRGLRTFVVLTLTLLGLTGVCGLVYLAMATNASSMSTDIGTTIGRSLFGTLAIGETILVAGLMPSLSAGAISGEEERKTLELLLVTPLKHHTILWGKLLSSTAFMGLLILAAIPLASLVLLFGGVSPVDMLLALGLLVLFSLTYGTLGLFCSVLIRRAGWARAAALATVSFLVGGTGFLAAIAGAVLPTVAGGGFRDPTWFLVPNPIVAIVDVVIPDIGFQLPGMPFWAYTAISYALWAAMMYGVSLLLLRRRRMAAPEERGRALAIVVVVGLGLLTLAGVCGLPILLTLGVRP